jgi:hypothetical protein
VLPSAPPQFSWCIEGVGILCTLGLSTCGVAMQV